MPNPLQGPTSGQISSERTHTEILPDASRGLVSSPVTPAPPPAAEPTYGRRIRLEAGTVDPEGIPRWHRSECLRPGPSRWVEPCKDCAGQPGYVQPSGAAHVTLSGERWHQEGCGHIRGRRQIRYERCLCPPGEASTTVARRNPRQGVRQRRVDDANRDTNHAIAHLFCGEFGLLILALLIPLRSPACLFAGRERRDFTGAKRRETRGRLHYQAGTLLALFGKLGRRHPPEGGADHSAGGEEQTLSQPEGSQRSPWAQDPTAWLTPEESARLSTGSCQCCFGQASPDDSSDVCRTVEMVAPVLCSAPGALAPDWGAGGRRSHH